MLAELIDEFFSDLKNGDEKAFRKLHKLYGGEIFTYLIRQFPQDRGKAEDIFQEVFLTAYTHIQSVKDADKVRAWLYRVASNKCIDSRRSKKGRHITSDNLKQTVQLSQNEGLDKEIIKRHISKYIDEAIERLPSEHRQVFILREMQSLQYDEIAHALNMTVSKAKKLMGQAVLRLQNEMIRSDIHHRMLA